MSGSPISGFQPRPGVRQFVKFSFFKAVPEWRRLDGVERDRQIAELAAMIEAWGERNLIRCYSTVGTRGDVDFMICWRSSSGSAYHSRIFVNG